MPGTLQLVQVTKTPVRIQSLLIENDTVMLVNPDTVNNIFIGNDPGSQIIPVPALGSVTLDTKKHDLWVSTNGGAFSVNAFLMPNGSNWVPSPAQVAAQINALGLAKDTTLQTTNTNTGNIATNTTGVAKDSTVSTVASNTTGVAKDSTVTGVAKDTSVQTVNTTLGNPSQRVDVQNLTTGGNPGGIPVLRGTDNFGTATGQTIASGVNATLVNGASVTKPGYEAIFQINLPAGVGTVPFAILQLIWTDSNTGLTVGLKQYILTSGNGPSNVLTYYAAGPCRGNQLTVKLRNQDPAQTITVTWAFNQTSHIYAYDSLLQATYAGTAPITFTNPNGNPSKGLLFSSNPSIGPNTNTTRLCAAYRGKVKINLDNTVQANSCAVQLNTPSNTGLYDEANPPTSTMKITAAAGAQAQIEWAFPNGAMTVQIFNQGATNTIAPNVTITTLDY